MFTNTSIAVKGFENLEARQIFWLPEKGGLSMLANTMNFFCCWTACSKQP
jgi:hypothetical protein